MGYTLHRPQVQSRNSLPATIRTNLISVAGLIGQDVVNQEGQYLGNVVDLVFRWDTKEPYPPLAGIIARVSRRHVWVTAHDIQKVSATKIELGTAKLDLREFKERNGEVRLVQEVLDHQLIDVDGARVVRASDLYIAWLSSHTRLVGVEVGLRSLFRRLGPRWWRARPVPAQVIDWASVQSFGGQGVKSGLKLSASRNELRRLRPGELADLLEDLGREERQELLNVLEADQVADAIEEMEPEEVETILREAPRKEAGRYLSNMEPDEAADALRDMDEPTRDKMLAHMTKASAKKVTQILEYAEELAGGFMNTSLFTANESEMVRVVRTRLKRQENDLNELESIAVVRTSGELVYDLPIIDLLTAGPKVKLRTLVHPSDLVTVPLAASIEEVANLLIDSRRPSILVVDEKQRPVGRIFADDVIDALLPSQNRLHFPRILS